MYSDVVGFLLQPCAQPPQPVERLFRPGRRLLRPSGRLLRPCARHIPGGHSPWRPPFTGSKMARPGTVGHANTVTDYLRRAGWPGTR